MRRPAITFAITKAVTASAAPGSQLVLNASTSIVRKSRTACTKFAFAARNQAIAERL